MLHIPVNSGSVFSIIGIDPGSNFLGVSVLFVDIPTMKIVSSKAWTICGEKLAGKNNWVEDIHGGRVNRILAIEENLLQTFNYYQPHLIASEAPFINNAFPQAGIALTEVIFAIRQAVLKYNSWKELYLIPPSSVKNAVGANGAGDKNKVKEKVIQLTDINYSCETGGTINNLDEHAIDALCVAYCRYKLLLA